MLLETSFPDKIFLSLFLFNDYLSSRTTIKRNTHTHVPSPHEKFAYKGGYEEHERANKIFPFYFYCYFLFSCLFHFFIKITVRINTVCGKQQQQQQMKPVSRNTNVKLIIQEWETKFLNYWWIYSLSVSLSLKIAIAAAWF